MQVLKEPEDNTELWHDAFSCTGDGWTQDKGKTPCGRLLDVNARDLQYRDHTDLAGDKTRYYGFTCCKCGCFTEIFIKEIPYIALKFAKPYLGDQDLKG